MTANEKVARRKLSMLQLAQELRSVSEACRLMGYSRSQFYEIKRAFQTGGLEALLDRPPIPGSTPHKIPDELEKEIVELSISHPAWGQARIADEMALREKVVSATTIRNVWIRNNLETRYKRMLELEKHSAARDFKLTEEQIRLLEKHNPEFAERHVESLYPGYLLCQDTFYVGTLKGVGRIYMQAVVDTYSSVAFAKLYTSKIAVTAADVLNDRVLPFFSGEGIAVNAVFTDNGTEYRGQQGRTIPTSSSCNSMRSSIASPRWALPGPTASWNAFTARCWTSSSGRPSERSSTARLPTSRQIWTPGCITTTTSVRIGVTVTRAGGPTRPSAWGKKDVGKAKDNKVEKKEVKKAA